MLLGTMNETEAALVHQSAAYVAVHVRSDEVGASILLKDLLANSPGADGFHLLSIVASEQWALATGRPGPRAERRPTDTRRRRRVAPHTDRDPPIRGLRPFNTGGQAQIAGRRHTEA